MGYACPVCGAEQADAVHLAHHLAVTASLGRAEHREWLAEHAPAWADSGPEELAEVVAPHAPEVDTPDFDDHGHDHEGARPSFEDELARQTGAPGRGGPAGSTRGTGDRSESVLAEARELTRQMYDSEDDGASTDDTDGEGDGAPDDGSGDERDENA